MLLRGLVPCVFYYFFGLGYGVCFKKEKKKSPYMLIKGLVRCFLLGHGVFKKMTKSQGQTKTTW